MSAKTSLLRHNIVNTSRSCLQYSSSNDICFDIYFKTAFLQADKRQYLRITLAPGEECDGYSFGYNLSQSLCLSGRVTKTLLLRSTRFFTQEVCPYYASGSVLLHDDSDLDQQLDSIVYFRIIQHWEIGQHMPSRCVSMSNVRCGENMKARVRHSERGLVIPLIVLLTQ